MAEAFAVLGIVASIVQLVDVGFAVLGRLNEFNSSLGETPATFRQIKAELPILLDTLDQTKRALDAGTLKDDTKKGLFSIIVGCQEQILSLDAVLQKTLPRTEDSRAKKSMKALSSLRKDKEVEKICSNIHKYIQTLTYYHAAASSTLQPLTGTRSPSYRK